MGSIDVVIGSTSGGMYWQALERMLADFPNISVEQLDNEVALLGAISSRQPQVFITEMSSHGLDPDCGRYFALRPGLVVVGLDPTGVESIVRMRDLGRDVLGRLIECLSATDQTTRPPPVVTGAFGDEQFATASADRDQSAPGMAVPYAGTTDHLHDLCRWLDLSFGERIASEPPAAVGATVGWTMDRGQALALLGFDADINVTTLGRQREDLEATLRSREAATRAVGRNTGFLAVEDTFCLTEAERALLLLTLAPELDSRFGRAVGFICDNLTVRRPTATVLAGLVDRKAPAAWQLRTLLAAEGILARYGLIGRDDSTPPGTPWSEIALAPASEIVARVLAADNEQPRYAPYVTLLPSNSILSDEGTRRKREGLVERLHELPDRPAEAGAAPVIQLRSDDDSRLWFEQTAQTSGREVVVLNLEHIEHASWRDVLTAAMAAVRVAVLHRAILLVTGLERLASDQQDRQLASRLVHHLRPLAPALAVHGEGRWLETATEHKQGIWLLERPVLDYVARVDAWQQAARAVSLRLEPAESQALASALRFEPAQMRATMALCRGTMPGNVTAISGENVHAKAREVARFDAPALVRRLATQFTWDDLVLPPPIVAQLHEIPSHVRQAGEVIERWGYAARLPYGQGVTAMFSGPSGTGKTMAAQIVARDLGVEIFQLDLSKTVSKYIGETEKNLDRIFDSAERASALLLIDEADALFGKRTEVKDAHDRYANVEVAYLLQRMEAYRGLAILTTNLRQNIDGSFLRRLRFLVEFPPPGVKERLAIWQRAFPRCAPCDPALDLTFLAQRFPLTGGHIQQIALLAAFAAAEEAPPGEGRISIHHVTRATRQQLTKLGMTTAEQNLAETAA